MCKVCEKCEHRNKFFPESVLDICEGSSLFDKNSCGFVNPETMQGIVLSVCDEVNHPLVFIQKRNKGCELKKTSECMEKVCQKKYGNDEDVCVKCNKKRNKRNNENREVYDDYYRLESNIFYSRLSGICKYVRKDPNPDGFTCGFQRCLYSDSYAAAYFLDRDSLPEDKKAKFENFHKNNIKKSRDYLQYTCDTTHYTELAVPVMLEGRTVGVLIFGQMLRKENVENHDRFSKEFSKKFKNDDSFLKDKDRFDNTVYDSKEFDKKIDECIHAVEKLEKKLINLLEVYRKWYIDEISYELLEKFPKTDAIAIPDGNLVSTEMIVEKYQKFKHALWKLADSLCRKMSISQMICFVPDILQNAINSPDYLYEINIDETESLSELKLDFKKFNKLFAEGKDKVVDQEQIKEIVLNLNANNSESDSLSYVLYVTSGESKGVMPIAVLFGYSQKQVREIKETEFIEELDSLIKKIKDPVYVTASSIINKYMELEQRRFIQVMRHELGQSYAGYVTLMDRFEKELYSSIKDLESSSNNIYVFKSAERAYSVSEKYIKNSRTFAHTVMLRVNSSRYSGGVQTPKKVTFYPYGEFLFKWKYIFSEVQKSKCLKFKMPIGELSSASNSYPLMYADPDMIEQVVYNLTNNAMKYSHFGSSITLNCYADKNKYILEVVNYGSPLLEEEKKLIFNYGYSGKNHHDKGSGLGLYISREIARRHGGELTVEQEFISDFNVPLLQLYTEDMPEKLFSEELFRDIKDEINKLKQKKDSGDASLWSQVLGNPIPQNPFTPLYISSNIKTKTARIKFTLTIPLDPENEEDVLI